MGLVRAELTASVSTRAQQDLVATNGTYLAYAAEGQEVVYVCSLKKVSAPPLKLLVHELVVPGQRVGRKGVNALHLGSLPGHRGRGDVLLEKRLFAATRRKVHCWNIEECYAAMERGSGADCKSLEVPEDCVVSHLRTDENLRWLAAASNSDVLIYSLQRQCLIMRLDGHSLQVNALQFHTKQCCDQVITASDDRTFKVWDLERRELAYESSMYGASPFVCLAIDPTFPRMAIGSTDGLVRFFDLMSPSYQLIQGLDIPLAVRRKFGEPVNQDKDLEEEGRQVQVITKGGAESVAAATTGDSRRHGKWKPTEQIGMACVSSVSELYYIKTEDRSEGKDLLPVSPKVIACTTQMLIIVDAYTYDIITIVPFSEYSYRNCREIDIDTPRLFVADNRSHGLVTICIGSAFTPVINVVTVAHLEDGHGQEGEEGFLTGRMVGLGVESHGNEGEGGEASKVSVFPTSPPKRLSKLYQAIEKENKHDSSVSSYESATRKKSLGKTQRSGNKPVTFHSRIKSSGYGKVEPLKFLGKQVQSRTLVKRASSNLKSGRLLKSYPMDCEPVHTFQDHHALDNDAAVHSAPILRVRFCPDGSRLATASVDKTVRTLRLPLAKHRGDGETFLGHGGPVLDASWNHSGNLILTGSLDRTACLWSVKKSQALIQIEGPSAGKKGKVAQGFKSDIKAARFFHLDKLVVLACMNKLHFFKYDLGPKKQTDDIARLHQARTHSHILELSTESQSVTNFDCHNGFISNLLVAGTSAKSIEVFDADACALVRRMDNAHSRAIHSIMLNSTSPYVSHDRSAHELFLSAASDSSVKLWDLRSPRSVRCFAGHLNRQNPIGVRFSPCMKYIACGSEDKVVYLYDVRMGTVIRKLRQGISDIVGDVCFHPIHPQLVAATYDGKLRFFSS
ncbi:WD40 repeat domain-containing protein [Chloropicon primus]|uniref:WD40 repeat domain-containing protein n=2 Tax=Chloropicon primus TaxID=1764295 RepID=A0A5B8MV50_9CHLO|nr:WD40 repeat domain-containing protein [Chloropicon primus]|eukprot:QDZ23515.1 WD40 repeat domain-containing protein [Chloropicon primus]